MGSKWDSQIEVEYYKKAGNHFFFLFYAFLRKPQLCFTKTGSLVKWVWETLYLVLSPLPLWKFTMQNNMLSEILEKSQINLTRESYIFNTLNVSQNIVWKILANIIKSGSMCRPLHILVSPEGIPRSYFSLLFFFKLRCVSCSCCILGSMVIYVHG